MARLNFLGPEDEVIIVDDESSDGTLDVASSLPRVHAVRNETRRGYGGTSRRLYELAIERGAAFAVNVHGDLGHPPEAVKDLAAALKGGDADMVLGSRYVFLRQEMARRGVRALVDPEVRNGMPMERIAGHAAITAVQNFLYGTKLYSFHEGMRGATLPFMQWCVSQNLSDWYDYDMTLMVAAHRAGWRITEIGVPPFYTSAAKSGVPLVRYGLNAVWQAVKGNRFTAGR